MKKLLFENFGLKIASVILAVILWILASSRGQSEMFIDVPLEFINVPSGFEMVYTSNKLTTLKVKGPESTIKNIKPTDIQVFIDLEKAKKGESIYYITRDNIQAPYTITILNISPSSVKIKTEEIAVKTVKVVPVITGVPEKGYSVKGIDVVPEKIDITGARSEVRSTKKISTEAFDITGLKETFTQDLKLDKRGKNIRTEPSSVTVTVIIEGGGKKQKK